MRLLLVDDSDEVRARLRDALRGEPGYEVVGESDRARQARDLVVDLRPDVVLLDVSLPDVSAAEATALVLSADPAVRVVALSSFPDAQHVPAMLGAGASGYLLKTAPAADIVAGLKVALAGRSVLDPALLRGVLGDLTGLYREQRERADGLAELDAMKRTFLSLVNDQLRTPLSAVTGAVATLQRGWDVLDDATKRDFLERIGAQAERLARRVGQIAMVANLSGGSGPRQRQQFSLAGVAREVSVALDHRFSGRELHVALDDGVVVTGDRTAALTVASTLLENAADHTAGTVTVAVRRQGGRGALCVSDEGPGLTPGDVDRLGREPFAPGDASDVREVGGLGLSLYLARRLLELDGGSLAVSSDVDAGSRFTALLPLAD